MAVGRLTDRDGIRLWLIIEDRRVLTRLKVYIDGRRTDGVSVDDENPT